MPPTNIILIMCDDLGYGDVGFNGNPIIQTPNLDRLAVNGIRFSRFYAGGPVCSPTRGTCLTGRHYFRYGITHANRGHLPAQEITLAQVLKSHGYTTGHFGKWHLGTLDPNYSGKPNRDPARNYAPPWQRDYDVSFATEYAVPTWDPTVGIDNRNQRLDSSWPSPYYQNGQLASENLDGCDSRVLMDRVIPFIEKSVANKQPFFSTIWFHAPHSPVVAGPEYRAMYSQYSEDEQHYYGCVTAVDDQVGRLYQTLNKLGVAEQTMVWFCSDNGPEGSGTVGRSRGSTAGLRGRKRSLFEGGVAVPAFLHWPGRVDRGRVVDMPCSTLDYFPTITELIDYTLPDRRPIDGVSLVPMMEGRMTVRTRLIPYRFDERKEAMFGSPTLAMTGNRYKCLTHLANPSSTHGRTDNQRDLCFDLITDRHETMDISVEQTDLIDQTRQQLSEWVDSCRLSHAGADYGNAGENFEPVAPFEETLGSWPSVVVENK